jgi:branched-chain amino acid transport system ATP-binding protein
MVKEIWNVVRTIRETGIATVIVDQNHAAVTALTDRSMILVKGQVVFDGPSAEVRANPELIQRHLGV